MLVGIVGRPNSGKSTFFKAATLMDVLIASYPFTTIRPNHGMAYVKIQDPAAAFGKVSNPREGYARAGWRFVPFEIIDVAGLVEGASEGRGLGNEFLNDLSAADAFIHVVDVSGESDGEGKPTEGYYPENDIKIVERELDLWYFNLLKKAWKVFARAAEMQHSNLAQEVARQFSGLKVTVEDIEHVLLKSKLNPEKPSAWTEEQLRTFAQMLRKHTKPMIIAANKIDRPASRENFERIKVEFQYPIVACFADGELAIREADKAGLINYIPGEQDFEIKKEISGRQRQALEQIRVVMKDFGSTGVQEVLNKVVFDLIEHIAVCPVGAKLGDSRGNIMPDCYLMRKGSSALDFAYRLHTDMGKNFVKAIDMRKKQAVGKDYKLKHLDVLEIVTK